jgi:hypothetical protein
MTQYCPQQLSNQIAAKSQYLELYCGGSHATATAAQTTEGSGAATKTSPGSATATATRATVGTAATGTAKLNSGLMTALASYVCCRMSIYLLSI